MSENHQVYYERDDVCLSPRSGNAHQILNVYIDLTGWKNGEPDPNAAGTYSYSLDFNDDANERQRVVCTGIRSGGMQSLLRGVDNDYGLTLSDATKVHVITPPGYLGNSSVNLGCVSKCSVQALRLYGMQALDVPVTRENNISIRLESVLDEVVHRTCNSYSPPLPRRRAFDNSVYHYDQTDRVLYEDAILSASAHRDLRM